MSDERPVVYLVCTGNAARSPMAAAMLRGRDDYGRLNVHSAGTLVVEGQPLGWRTRAALGRIGLTSQSHRSRQFTAKDAAAADLIAVMEPSHVAWMRRRFPEAAAVTGCLRRLARDLPSAAVTPSTDDRLSIRERVASLGLASIVPEPWEEVVDPGAGDRTVFHRCAIELLPLIDELYRRLLPAAPVAE